MSLTGFGNSKLGRLLKTLDRSVAGNAVLRIWTRTHTDRRSGLVRPNRIRSAYRRILRGFEGRAAALPRRIVQNTALMTTHWMVSMMIELPRDLDPPLRLDHSLTDLLLDRPGRTRTALGNRQSRRLLEQGRPTSMVPPNEGNNWVAQHTSSGGPLHTI